MLSVTYLQPATELTCFQILYFSILNSICGDSDTSEGGVGLGMFFYVDWFRNYVNWCSGERFMVVLGDRSIARSIAGSLARSLDRSIVRSL